MKLKSAFLVGIMSIVGLASCISEDFGGVDIIKDKGDLVLDVNVLKPESRAVTEVQDFPVVIYSSDEKQVASYNQVSDVPEKISLAVGTYTVESHTPGVIAKKMFTPYYKGEQSVEILKGIKSNVEVLCKMQNSLITLNYDDEFKAVFESWDITIDDGSNVVLSFSNTDLSNSVYWYFGEKGVEQLTVNFRGKTKEGSTVTARNVLTKDQANESYNDDRDYFCGGDALTLNFTPTESTDGKVSGINLYANVTFTETNEDVPVNVVDKPGFEEGPDAPPTPGPGGNDNAIKLTVPAPITLSADDAATADPSTGDVKIESEDGIKSVLVKVDSKSDEMMEQLGAVADEYEGVDLVHGCEVVGNQNLVAFLASLGKTISVPSVGDKSYTFPVGQFYLFLGILPGEHNFIMTVTDVNGAKKEGTIKVTITE